MSLCMNSGWPRRIHQLLGCAAIVSAISFAGATAAAAQAGSAGGTIGKQDKSVSGGEETEVSRPARSQRHGQGQRQEQSPRQESQKQEHSKSGPTTASGHNSDGSCRSIAGVWTSWAAGVYGRNDTRINANGTISHPSSKATWSCSGGEYTQTWDAFGVRGPYRLSADGKRLIKIQDGSVSFSRN